MCRRRPSPKNCSSPVLVRELRFDQRSPLRILGRHDDLQSHPERSALHVVRRIASPQVIEERRAARLKRQVGAVLRMESAIRTPFAHDAQPEKDSQSEPPAKPLN